MSALENDGLRAEVAEYQRSNNRLKNENERLREELAEFTQLKEYAKSLGQRTYLEIEGDNVRLRAENADLLQEVKAIMSIRAENAELREVLTMIGQGCIDPCGKARAILAKTAKEGE